MFDKSYSGRLHPAQQSRETALERSSGRRMMQAEQAWSEATIEQSEFRQAYADEQTANVDSNRTTGRQTFVLRNARSQSAAFIRTSDRREYSRALSGGDKAAIVMGGLVIFCAMLTLGDFPGVNPELAVTVCLLTGVFYAIREAAKRPIRAK